MYIELAAIGYLIGSYVYREITKEPPPKRRDRFEVPINEENRVRAKIFGRDRVRQPVIEWMGAVTTEEGPPVVYRAHTFLSAGIGFDGGAHDVHGAWVGDRPLQWIYPLAEIAGSASSPYGFVGGVVEKITNGIATADVRGRMISEGISEDHIPGYKNRIACFFYNVSGGWYWGGTPSFPSTNLEVSSYGTNHSRLGTYARVGSDSNPVNVIYEILTGWDMCALPESIIDMDSFVSAQYRLHTETHGYSRVWDERTEAADMLFDVLRQIDGFIFEDQVTGKIKIKLARNDYVPADLPVIKRSNCRKITGFAMSSRVDVVNKVTVIFENREKNYDDDSASAQNMANAAGMDGQVVEEVIEYRGCKSAVIAARLAGRELGVRSKPNVKMTAHVSRAFLRTTIGDVVKVEWNAPDINAVFRVVGVDRGEPGDEMIRLDLILDHNYVWRNENPTLIDIAGEIQDDPVFSGGLT